MDKNTVKNYRQNERGSARIKFFSILLFLFLLGNAAFNYIPVAYQGENFKQEMQTAIVQGVSLPGRNVTPADTVKAKLIRAAKDNNLPPAVIDVRQPNNVVTAHVTYSKGVSILPFGIYDYNYVFDHTATPTGFLMKN
jgi:hypothetical protein